MAVADLRRELPEEVLCGDRELSLTNSERHVCDDRLMEGAYYYSFTPTGNEAVDLVLGALSRAGKMYHHTGDWMGEPWAAGEKNARDLIQAAANDAARMLDTPTTPAEEG